MFELRFSPEYFSYATAILKLNMFKFYFLFHNISEYEIFLRYSVNHVIVETIV